MTKVLGIRFIGRSNVATIINFIKCCFAGFLLLLVAFRAEAVPQNALNKSDLSSFMKSGNSTSTRWAVPSPSCSSRSACNSDANFRQEFNGFVNFVHSHYPSAHVPSAEQLQQRACKSLASGGTRNDDNNDSVSMDQWLTTFLSFSYWSTQAGMNPYQTSPVWWCFLDNSSKYVVTDVLEVNGANNIIANFDGLGKPAASGGAGFYVNQADLTEVYPAISLEPGFLATQSYVNKELVAIDLAAPGTTKPLAQYQALIKVKQHDTRPFLRIELIRETVNALKTIQWLGLCSFACVNCTPGTVCPT